MSRGSYGKGYGKGYDDAKRKYDKGGGCAVIIGMMSAVIGVLALIVKIL